VQECSVGYSGTKVLLFLDKQAQMAEKIEYDTPMFHTIHKPQLQDLLREQ